MTKPSKADRDRANPADVDNPDAWSTDQEAWERLAKEQKDNPDDTATSDAHGNVDDGDKGPVSQSAWDRPYNGPPPHHVDEDVRVVDEDTGAVEVMPASAWNEAVDEGVIQTVSEPEAEAEADEPDLDDEADDNQETTG